MIHHGGWILWENLPTRVSKFIKASPDMSTSQYYIHSICCKVIYVVCSLINRVRVKVQQYVMSKQVNPFTCLLDRECRQGYQRVFHRLGWWYCTLFISPGGITRARYMAPGKGKQTNRASSDRKTDIDTNTNWETDSKTHKQTDRHTITYRNRDCKTHTQVDGQTNNHTQTEKNADWVIDGLTYIQVQAQAHT